MHETICGERFGGRMAEWRRWKMKQIYLRPGYGDQVRERRWIVFIEQLDKNFGDLLLDWTLEICLFEPTPSLPDFLTKHDGLETFRMWYQKSRLDSWEEVIKREFENFYVESWHKMSEKEKRNKLELDLRDAFGKGSYFGRNTSTKILNNLPREIRDYYGGCHKGCLFLRDPILKRLIKENN